MIDDSEDYLSPKNLALVRRRIRWVLSGYGLRARSDDCAQDYVLHILDGKGAKQTIDQFVIDWVRKNFGDNRTASFKEKRALANAASYEHFGFERTTHSNRAHLDDLIDRKRLIQELEGRAREIAILHFQKGLTSRQIAEQLGVTYQWIDKVIREIIKLMAERSKELSL